MIKRKTSVYVTIIFSTGNGCGNKIGGALDEVDHSSAGFGGSLSIKNITIFKQTVLYSEVGIQNVNFEHMYI